MHCLAYLQANVRFVGAELLGSIELADRLLLTALRHECRAIDEHRLTLRRVLHAHITHAYT
jgi:hypothetical protein